jgi:Flp pilus assembly protein TadG
MVEFAITLPLLVCFLLGMFTGGTTFNQKLAITNGVREGSRYGATLAVTSSSCGTMNCWLSNVANVTQAASEGEIAASVANMQICVAYVYAGTTPAPTATDQTARLIRDSAGDHFSTGSTCFSDSRPDDERRVQVSAQRDGKIEFMFGTVTPTLSSVSVSKFEAI